MEIQKKLSRRDFIKITAAAGGAMVGGKLLFDLAAENFVTVKDTRLLMGTIINLTVVAESRGAGEGAVDATFAELERQVAILTTGRITARWQCLTVPASWQSRPRNW